MSSDSDIAISVGSVGKCYRIYDRPQDRLIQALRARVERLFGRAPKPSFREFWALNDVTLRIPRGQTVGIVGRNGAGKSTLLQVICGTLAPTLGEVAVRGRVAALLELGTGFNPDFTGRENIHLNASILGLGAEEIRSRFDDIVAFADIGDFIDQPAKTYSSGMYVRLAFAVIAHVDADILVIDEALAVGDVFFAQKCMRFLRDFQKRGTVLFVSHSSASIVSLCERAIWLEGGRVAMDGPAKGVCEAYLANFYGHRPNGGDAANLVAQEATPQDPDESESMGLSLDHAAIRVFRFDPDKARFGDGRAKIAAIRLEGADGRQLTQLSGGESVSLVVEAVATGALERPIVGFFVKDRLGQYLFGTNTDRDERIPSAVSPGGGLSARFEFRMPYLPNGRYTVDAAIADGTHHDHVQTDWMFDGLVLESTQSTVSTGLVGIPYRRIALAVTAPTSAVER